MCMIRLGRILSVRAKTNYLSGAFFSPKLAYLMKNAKHLENVGHSKGSDDRYLTVLSALLHIHVCVYTQ